MAMHRFRTQPMFLTWKRSSSGGFKFITSKLEKWEENNNCRSR